MNNMLLTIICLITYIPYITHAIFEDATNKTTVVGQSLTLSCPEKVTLYSHVVTGNISYACTWTSFYGSGTDISNYLISDFAKYDTNAASYPSFALWRELLVIHNVSNQRTRITIKVKESMNGLYIACKTGLKDGVYENYDEKYKIFVYDNEAELHKAWITTTSPQSTDTSTSYATRIQPNTTTAEPLTNTTRLLLANTSTAEPLTNTTRLLLVNATTAEPLTNTTRLLLVNATETIIPSNDKMENERRGGKKRSISTELMIGLVVLGVVVVTLVTLFIVIVVRKKRKQKQHRLKEKVQFHARKRGRQEFRNSLFVNETGCECYSNSAYERDGVTHDGIVVYEALSDSVYEEVEAKDSQDGYTCTDDVIGACDAVDNDRNGSSRYRKAQNADNIRKEIDNLGKTGMKETSVGNIQKADNPILDAESDIQESLGHIIGLIHVKAAKGTALETIDNYYNTPTDTSNAGTGIKYRETRLNDRRLSSIYETLDSYDNDPTNDTEPVNTRSVQSRYDAPTNGSYAGLSPTETSFSDNQQSRSQEVVGQRHNANVQQLMDKNNMNPLMGNNPPLDHRNKRITESLEQYGYFPMNVGTSFRVKIEQDYENALDDDYVIGD